MVSAQKNITVKAYTHSHIYSHIQTELNNSKIENSPNFEYKYLTALSTGSKKLSMLSRGSSPAVHSRYLLSKTVLKEVKT